METTLDRRVGAQALIVTVGGTVRQLSTIGPVTIRHGRQDVDSQPSASTCSLAILAGHGDQPPSIGDEVTVELGPDAVDLFGMDATAEAAARWRFVGTVTDPRAKLDGKGRAVYAVTAASRRAKLGRAYIGDSPWPAELDGARAVRIFDLVDDLVDVVATPDPGTVEVVARDVDRQPALALLDDLAIDTAAVLVELRDGQLDWHDAEHRRDAVPVLTLDASQVLSPAEWAQTQSGMVNDLTVEYGSAEPKATVRIVNEASVDVVDGYGPFAAKLDTQLSQLVDAEAFARLTIARRSRPWWRLDRLDVDLLRTVSPSLAAQLLALNFGDLVAVTGFPSSGPFTTTRLWTEGWTETITAKAWRLALNVSEYATTVAATRWVDVPTWISWPDVDGSLTWYDAASWDPGLEDLGRWTDYPVDVAWTDLDADPTTWDDLG